MKSPWKFIGRLLSRRQSKEAAPETVEDPGRASSDIAAEREPSDQPTPSDHSARGDLVPEGGTEAYSLSADAPNKVSQHAIDDENGASEPTAGQAPDEVAPNAVVSSQANQATGSIPKRQTRRKRVLATKPMGGEESAPSAVERQVEQERPAFEREVATVEADLRALRRQLAEKLKQQNAQLRKMLERFGGE